MGPTEVKDPNAEFCLHLHLCCSQGSPQTPWLVLLYLVLKCQPCPHYTALALGTLKFTLFFPSAFYSLPENVLRPLQISDAQQIDIENSRVKEAVFMGDCGPHLSP